MKRRRSTGLDCPGVDTSETGLELGEDHFDRGPVALHIMWQAGLVQRFGDVDALSVFGSRSLASRSRASP